VVFHESNRVSVDIFISPPLNAANECDTVAEADNFPGVKRLRLTRATGSKNYGQITTTGHLRDVYPSYEVIPRLRELQRIPYQPSIPGSGNQRI